MTPGSILIAPGTQYCEIHNLKNNQSYSFTVKSIDKNGNKSNGRTKTFIPKQLSLRVVLEQSVIEKTNQNIDVNILIKSDYPIQLVKWAKGSQPGSYFEAYGNILQLNSGNYSFKVSENGTYTVYVKDTKNNEIVKTVSIENIDNIGPSALKGFNGSYNAGNKKIILTWSEPLDKDYEYVIINDGTEYKVKKGTRSLVIDNVEADDRVHNFTAITYDQLENKGATAECSIKAEKSAGINTINLSRNHVVYNDIDNKIDVAISGSNFNLINSASDRTIKVGVFDSNGYLQGTLSDAVIDIGTNTAKTFVTIPGLSKENATIEGTVYTVKAKICGAYSDAVAKFIVSREAMLTASPTLSITKIPSIEVSEGSKTTLTFKGVNLDTLKSFTVNYFDSDNNIYGNPVIVDTSAWGNAETEMTVDIPIPMKKEGVFKVIILFDNVIQEKYNADINSNYDEFESIKIPTIQVYGDPDFTSFIIPKAGIQKEDTTVIATVKGANFKAPNVSLSNFDIKCNNPSVICSIKEIIDDATIKVGLTIPGSAGNYIVTISSGAKNIKGNFEIKDYSSYKIGDILLNDGNKVPYSGISEADKAKAVAVVCGFNQYGAALGVGLKQSESNLIWAKDDTTGYNTKFTDIICTPSKTGTGAADTATFTGDVYGGDNWGVICGVDPTGTANAATNYPAFDWVNNYGTANNLTSDYAKGWYMPSIAELAELYKNKDSVNAALKAVGGTELNSYYWSSSQLGSYYSSAWGLSFSDGNVDSSNEDNDGYVCCIRAF